MNLSHRPARSREMPTPRSGRAAFTILELLAVIVVIATLVAMLLPSLSGATARTRRAKCAANLRSLATAVTLYQLGHRDDVPVAENPFNDATGLVRDVVCQPLEAMRSELDFAGEWGSFAPARCPSDERVWRYVGTSYLYVPSVSFGFLSLYTAGERESRILEVERLYRLGFYTDLWMEVDRSAHAGSRRENDISYQVAASDGAVRFVQVQGGGGFDLTPWLPP